MGWPGHGTVSLPDAPRRGPRAPLDAPGADAVFGHLEIHWRSDQPVHVSAGPWAPRGGLLARAAARHAGALAIPGYALRAAARARLEAISRACAGVGLRPAVTDPADPFRPCVAGGPVCPACAVFGAPGLRGRVLVDAAVTDAQPAWVPLPQPPPLPDDALPARRFEGGPSQESAGPIGEAEVIPPAAELKGAVHVDGLTLAEMGATLAAFGLAPGTFTKVGAAKAMGFGRLRPAHVDWHLTDAAGQPLAPDPARWRAAFVRSADYWRPGEEGVVKLFTRGDW